LPTEAEWEYACRAGAVTSWYYGESEELLEKYACYLSNSFYRSWPVGSLKPNDFGLFDTHGNVWTWCQERYRNYTLGKDEKRIDDKEDSLFVNDKESRVLRGGSFFYPAGNLRSAYRFFYTPAARSNNVGLRPARTFTTE
jgi:formylglycine-generating enzyme required for sulfatase activity